MKPLSRSPLLLSLLAILITAAVSSGANALATQSFTEPSSPPPNNNADAPLDVSYNGQSKTGGLELNTGLAAVGLIVHGNVGIGTLTPGSDVAMTGGLTINGSNMTQLTVQKNDITGFALNTNVATPGDWSMYDKVGDSWNLSLTSSGGNIGIGTLNPVTTLNVIGKVGAAAYCDQNGQNCTSTLGGGPVANYNDLPSGATAGWCGYTSSKLNNSSQAITTGKGGFVWKTVIAPAVNCPYTAPFAGGSAPSNGDCLSGWTLFPTDGENIYTCIKN